MSIIWMSAASAAGFYLILRKVMSRKTFMKTKWWTEPMTKYGKGVTAANMGMNDPLHGVFDSTAVALVDGKIDSRSRILHFGNHDITDMKAQDISHGKEEIKFEGMYRDE